MWIEPCFKQLGLALCLLYHFLSSFSLVSFSNCIYLSRILSSIMQCLVLSFCIFYMHIFCATHHFLITILSIYQFVFLSLSFTFWKIVEPSKMLFYFWRLSRNLRTWFICGWRYDIVKYLGEFAEYFFTRCNHRSVVQFLSKILAIIFTMRKHIKHTLSHGTREPEKWSRPKYKNVFDGFREKA